MKYNRSMLVLFTLPLLILITLGFNNCEDETTEWNFTPDIPEEYIEAEIDGVLKKFDTFVYISNLSQSLGQLAINGSTEGTPYDDIVILYPSNAVVDTPYDTLDGVEINYYEGGSYNPTAVYRGGPLRPTSSITLTLTSAGTAHQEWVEGTFSATLVDPDNVSDTIEITNGTFTLQIYDPEE